jgi:DNA modification methylase
MPDLAWANTTRRLGDLIPWPRNPRQIKRDQAKRLVQSFDEFGQVETIAIGPGNEVYNGHQRLNVLMEQHGPDYVVECRQSSRALTEKEREKLTVFLHKGAAGEWDWDTLANEFEFDELVEWGFDAKELLGLDFGEVEPAEDPGAQVDKAEELREKWGVEPGQLWQLGEHRLICGDCTDAAVVERVMGGEKAEMVWTDPPYGVAVGDKNVFLNSIAPSNRIEKNLENDTLDEPELVAMLCKAFDNAIAVCLAGAAWHVAAPPGPLHVLFGQVLKDRGIWRQTIQWVKNNATFAPLGVCYHWRAEPIFFGWLPNGSHRFYGGRKQDTVWEIDRPTKSSEHPTMKPVELVERAVENHTRPKEIVLDVFSGSGTTLIACERLGRKCRAVEISPAYVAVALERWGVLTNKTPQLISRE